MLCSGRGATPFSCPALPPPPPPCARSRGRPQTNKSGDFSSVPSGCEASRMDTTPKAANTVHGTNFCGHGTNWDTKRHRPLHWGYRLRGGNRRRYPDVLTAQTTGVNHLSMSKLPNTPEGVSSQAGSFCSTLLARQLLILRPTSFDPSRSRPSTPSPSAGSASRSSRQ